MSCLRDDPKLTHCPALVAVKTISGKWKTRVLWALRDGPSHFRGLLEALPGVSAKVLTEQIRQMEADGLIARTEEIRDGVGHTLYDFTDYGRTLIPILNALGAWGLAHEARKI